MPLKRAAAILYTELTMQPFLGYGLNDLYLSTLLLLLPKSNYPIKRAEIDFYKTVPRWKLTWFPVKRARRNLESGNFSTLLPVTISL